MPSLLGCKATTGVCRRACRLRLRWFEMAAFGRCSHGRRACTFVAAQHRAVAGTLPDHDDVERRPASRFISGIDELMASHFMLSGVARRALALVCRGVNTSMCPRSWPKQNFNVTLSIAQCRPILSKLEAQKSPWLFKSTSYERRALLSRTSQPPGVKKSAPAAQNTAGAAKPSSCYTARRPLREVKRGDGKPSREQSSAAVELLQGGHP